MIKLELKGVEELKRTFAKLGKDFEEAVAASMITSGFVVSNEAKQTVPVLTGNLKRSIFPSQVAEPQPIEQQTAPPPVQNKATVQRDLQADGRATLLIGTNVSYAPPIEYLRQPFLRPALENNRAEVNRVFNVALRQIISRAGRG